MPPHPKSSPPAPAEATNRLRAALREYWGYDEFRPLQLEAMQAVLAGRDSVVVLPTGGGKSLCYQVPAVVLDGLAVIVSPLISLMKDQVDALVECGIPAAAINSTLSASEKSDIATEIRSGRLKLLYVAPERLCTERMLDFLTEARVSMIAIDEAHCISAWGHDFRPEYRILGTLRERFPGVAVHAYTATATETVRDDISAQLHQVDPLKLVGGFDRPNLNYFVERRAKVGDQIRELLDRRKGESGIIYGFSRKEVDSLAAELKAEGFKAAPYHAGLTDLQRQRNQDGFVKEKIDVIVATVAFGMGIDKPNVRFVVHTHAPQSLEHYQQETGRAGRDGLPSECRLFYSAGDFVAWTRLKSDLDSEARLQFKFNLRAMEQYCQSAQCRHKSLVEYFGQEWHIANCQACDICLEEVEFQSDALVTAQKILSCVVRVKERYGADYVSQVLIGAREQRILDNGHDQLSTWGLLREFDKKIVRGWIEQLIGQDHLRAEGEYRQLTVTPLGRDLLKGAGEVRLLAATGKPKSRSKAKSKDASSFEGVDLPLFEILRKIRREIADARGIPPFAVFGDVTLRELARVRPDSLVAFRQVPGIGDHRTKQYGDQFVAAITAHCTATGLATNQPASSTDSPSPATSARAASRASPSSANESSRGSAMGGTGDTSSRAARTSASDRPAIQDAASALFAEGRSLAEVGRILDRAASTTIGYLVTYLAESGATNPEPWLDAATFARIRTACEDLPLDRLAPIFAALDGQIGYDEVKLAVACLRNQRPK